jgi:cytochrome c biogenesis protein
LSYQAFVRYSVGSRAERAHGIEVNHPLRLPGANVYLLQHGFAPILRYTDRYGRAQTTAAPFLPMDARWTSQGVAAFPDANVDPKTGAQDPRGQVGFFGVYVPTASGGGGPAGAVSAHPEERDPVLVLVAYTGDLGLDDGVPRSVYTLDQRLIDTGKLVPVAGDPHRMRSGDTWTLPDGSRVEFLGTRPWVTLTVRHDPGELPVLVSAGLLLVGLLVSLTGKRRRFWFRVDADGRTVEAAALPRTEYAGFTEEFDGIVSAARKEGIF